MYVAWAWAICASTSLSIGLYLMKREAERLPSLGGGWRWTAWWAFVRDPWWIAGLALQILGYALYLLALRAAPLSIVSAAMNGGIALFVIFAVVGMGESVRALEWVGVALVMVALVVLSASVADAPASRPSGSGLLPFSLTVLALSAGAVLAQRARRAVGLSVASGLLLGLGSVYAKELTMALSLTAAVLTLGANFAGFVLMQAAFQSGRGVVVMPLFSVLSNLVPIIGGIVVYRESMPPGSAGAILRPVAFVLAIGGAALLTGFGERPSGELEIPN
jgi:multidrug transporter EmrE-like cation transporter